ncbi:MAG: 16S rRNA (cytosine(1402)-N(4))-methyltransferase RsmH [Proteobacteria bacterium]|nr:16S rRNA (cytosine(1402)-N(4))-methyltransferase RsmH [Pseudomonadota bacterium]
MNAYTHVPVLKKEILEYLNIKDGNVYVDCTAGRGGHLEGILQSGAKNITVLAIDKDPSNVAFLKDVFSKYKNVTIINSDYRFLADILKFHGIKKVDGIIFDLGFSSIHIDDASRGFSFAKDGPLDMRYDTNQGLRAEDVINEYPERELGRIIRDYGEEKFFKNISRQIVKAREEKKITTTLQLKDIIHRSIPTRFRAGKKIDAATKTFQAIRIEVNTEFESLKAVLPDAINALNTDGRLCAITFHSIEDRIVKQSVNKAINPCTCPKGLVQCVCGKKPTLKRVIKMPLTASKEEIRLNPRSRSAKLRIAQRI